MQKMKKIFILGISSFSGAALASYLVKKKYRVFGTFYKKKNIYLLPLDKKKIKIFKIDLLKDTKKLLFLIKKIKPEVIVDHASICMVGESWLNPDKYFKINVNSKIDLIKGLKNSKFLKKYIYISTPEIFGSKSKRIDEFCSEFNPSTPYASSKLASELNFRHALLYQNFPIIISRFSNFYGPNQPLYRLIPKVIMSIKKNKKFPLEGGGQSIRNFIYTDDFCSGINKLIVKGELGKIYHFSGNKFLKITKIIKLICDIKKVSYKKLVKVTSDRIGKDNTYKLKCLWTKKKLNWSEKVSIKQGLYKTIVFYDKFFEKFSKKSLEYKFTN